MKNEKHYFKRTLSLLLCLVMICSVFAGLNITASAATNGYYTYTVSNGEATITGVDQNITGKINVPSELGGYPVTSIGRSAFYFSKATSVTIPNSVTNIASYAFNECANLKSVTIPNSVITIGETAFIGCYELSSLTIPASVKSIGGTPVSWCSSLSSITVDSKNKYYSSANGVLFNKAKTKLIEYPENKAGTRYVVPGSVKYIGDYAFDRTELTRVIFSKALISIGDFVFNDGSLTSLIIPDNVTSIGEHAFVDCYELTAVTIGKSLKKIENNAFYWTGIKKVYYRGTKTQWKKINFTEGNDILLNANRYYNCGICDMYGGHSYKDYVCKNCGGWQYTTKAPVLKSGKNTIAGVQIAWSKLGGAKSYIVYRKTSKSGWSKVGTTTGTTLVDKTAKNNVKYYYTVKAQRDTEYSKYNNTGLAVTFMSAPKITSIANANSGVTVKWGKVSGATTYYVYRKTTGGWTKLGSTKSTSYTDTKAKAGTTYTYTIRAAKTGAVSAACASKKITRLTTPKLTKLTATAGKNTLTFGKVTGAASYVVYRKTTGGWSKLATVKTNSYVDKNIKKGVTYTYTVRAVKDSYLSAYNATGLKVKAK